MTLQKHFCQRSASQPKCGVTARNIILIYYLIRPPPSDAVTVHYELQRFKTLSSRTVDRFSRETTSRSHDSHAAERRLILLSLVAGGRKTGGRSREREIQSMLLVFLQTPNYLLGKLKGEGKNVQLLLRAPLMVLSLKPLSLIHCF